MQELAPGALADLARRFSGLERLYGVNGAAAIRAAHVAVIGIGGVGSWAAEALARSGVGQITLIDFDQVAESNINRQIHADTTSVGKAKVDAMSERILLINPQCKVNCVEEFATPDNWPSLAAANFDAVLDCCDQQSAKTALAAWALDQTKRLKKQAPLFITSGAAGGKRRAEKVDISDLSETTHDPLLADLRYRLRRQHGAPREKKIGITCVFSKEAVAPPDPSCNIEEADGSLNCHGFGSVVSVTASFGMCAAGWVLDELARKSN
ncbi:tRNA threonylcarbamoyladenosine dehydratase [Variovorax sp. PCZ-1]|uniref:tRNA threonylcarbamoyladenosine dehydratase n=1 Tax=Variovorax sp. PCZ-1 TaxID=2835533 RepID=UPI001BCD59A8|nr:tRNA threonylcarbamoyladenosine dehydratase [Variovorax sp. PCZ-1]MBS7807030.1 tRNA threonylcarbamoyladenosine dehydratase [Variovorax sp. PCZ-1]